MWLLGVCLQLCSVWLNDVNLRFLASGLCPFFAKFQQDGFCDVNIGLFALGLFAFCQVLHSYWLCSVSDRFDSGRLCFCPVGVG